MACPPAITHTTHNPSVCPYEGLMLKTSALFSVHGGNLSLVNFFDTNFYVCEGCEYKVQFWTVFLDTHAHTLHLPLTLYPP